MPHEDDGPLLRVQHGLRGGHVSGERDRRVLHDADVVALGLEQLVDGLPAPAVDKAAVDQHHVVDAVGGGAGGRAGGHDAQHDRGGEQGGEQCTGLQFHDDELQG
ncbi:hypothetical protein D3C86_1836600 [compost metagenome]